MWEKLKPGPHRSPSSATMVDRKCRCIKCFLSFLAQLLADGRRRMRTRPKELVLQKQNRFSHQNISRIN